MSPRDDEQIERREERETTSRTTYMLVFVALMVLLVLTAVADQFQMGVWNTVSSIGIAVAKTALIVTFFMHLRGSPTLVKAAAGTGLLWLSIAVCLTLADELTRGWRDPLPSASDRDLIPQGSDRYRLGPDIRPPRVGEIGPTDLPD